MTHGVKYYVEVMRQHPDLGTTAVVLGPYPTMARAQTAMERHKDKVGTLADPPRGVPHLRIVKVLEERYMGARA